MRNRGIFLRSNIALFFNSSSLGSNLNPFFVMEIKQLSKHFERVEVFCRQPQCGFKELADLKNVRFFPISKNKKWTVLPLLPYLLCQKEVRTEIKNAKKKKKFTLPYFFALCNFLLQETVMEQNAGKKGAFVHHPLDWVLYAYWLDIDAYAVTRLKQKTPTLAAISRAHSFEINPVTNPYFDLFFKGKIHSTLDHISFISEEKRKFYCSTILPFYEGLTADKLTISRLGTEKKSDFLNQKSQDGVFRLFSCSRVIPLKRLDLLMDALEYWQNGKLEWTHIGDGSDLVGLKERAETLDSSVVTVRFLGECSNDEVHQYYQQNAVDLFVNVSTTEGIPVTFMEAMSYGIPVFATDVGGSGEIVDGDTGILVEADSTPEQLCERLLAFAKLDEDCKDKMRQAAFDRWNAEFNLQKNSLAFSDFCKSL